MEDKLKNAVNLLKTLKRDAKMALSGEWDKSDSGFESQIDLINDFLIDLEDNDLLIDLED